MSDALKDLKKALEHQQEGDHAVAAALLREVLKRHPDDADALHLLGLSLHADGRHDNALASIEQAIAVQPGEVMFHTNAGAVALALGRAGPAAEHHRQAIAIDPAHADAHNNLAIVLERQGDWEEAEAHLLKAIALKPDFANAHGNLGNLLRRQGRLEEAEASYHRALAIAPDLAEVHNSLGNAMRYMGRHDEAIARFERAIELNPGYAEAHANKGMALAASGYTDAAAEALEAAIAIRPDPAFRIMHAGLMPVIPASADEIARWRRRFADAFEALIAEDIRIDQGILDAPVMSFYLAYHGENDRDLMVELARFYIAASPALEWTAPHCRPGAARARRDRLRVGVLSRYFGDHAVAWMVQGLLAELPRDAMEVVALALGQHGEAVSSTMRRAVDVVVTVPYSLDGAREAIGALEFDILIYADIGMEVFSYFLAFARLAPVQCVTRGHPDTTGIPAVDYYLSNDIAEPEYAEASYSEPLVRLAGVQSWYARSEVPDPLPPRAAFDLAEDATLYFCPQSLFKIHPDMDPALAEILRRDPAGRIVVFDGPDPNWAKLLLQRWRPVMGEDFERAQVLPRTTPDQFLGILALADVVLDSWPFGGGNTNYQSFALGLPVVTLPGRYNRGRGVMSHYHHMKIEGCVAENAEEFVDIAVRLGTDRAWRDEIVRQIAERSDAIFEDEVAVAALAEFLEGVAP